jgi:hypothetical protein
MVLSQFFFPNLIGGCNDRSHELASVCLCGFVSDVVRVVWKIKRVPGDAIDDGRQ